MRKIRIDANLAAVALEFQKDLDIYKQDVLNELIILRDCFDGTHYVSKNGSPLGTNELSKCQSYIKKLTDDYEKGRLILAQPNCFDELHDKYKTYLTDNELQWKISIDKDNAKPLHVRITKAMGYKKYVRSAIYPALMRKMGIKACVYCNANYAVTTAGYDGLFEIDHWKPESSYPFLCTSFYNLQPCCPFCNKRKSADAGREYFKLYEEDKGEQLEVFKFQLPKGNLVRYVSSLDSSCLKIEFKEADSVFKKLRDDANEKFKIEGIYNEHIDVVEEIVWRSIFYNQTIVGTMTWCFGRTHLAVDIARFKLGTYSGEDEVHKRPLTKMMQDVGKQLGII